MTSVREAIDATLVALPERLRVAGEGSAACCAIAEVYDRQIAERFVAASEGQRLALVATGGWARRELAPYSDIDFIVLHERNEKGAKLACDRLLYPLWDEKLAIGHSVREPRAVARLARDDLATATALLDARHIAGDRALTAELVQATLAALAPGGNPNELIKALAAEKQARHARFGASLYLLEPNLKQGIGALRDLSTALWCAQIRWHPPRPDQLGGEGAGRLVRQLLMREHITPRQAMVVLGARDFLLRVRALVQLQARRRFDQLTFEIQEAIAPPLYPDARAPGEAASVQAAVAPAVEALMRDYYLHARGVLQVADRLLERAQVPTRGRPRIVPLDASFVTRDGELAIRDPQLFIREPSEIVRLFRVAVGERLAVSGDTRELAAETIARDPAPLAGDPLAARLLLDALADPRDDAQPSALEVMNQLGVLSAVMPDWAPCVGRVQHDLYHVYTVDQHQLYALAMQKRIARGELAAEHPTATELWREVRRPAPLYLATLLHDVGKPMGKGHAEKGAVVAGVIARRLGLPPADALLTEFLVRQHLTMSHLSQRRDLSDPEVVARFAERVGDDEHLVQLYLLTLCDAAMTAPDNLTAWKADLLRDLMQKTRAYFRGAPAAAVESGVLAVPATLDDAAASSDARAKAKVIQLVDDPAALAIIEGIDPRLFTQLMPRQAARHVKLVGVARSQTPSIALEVRCFPLKGHSELAIVAPDAPGVLAAIAGALTANRVDVLGAVLGHVELPDARLVTDVFYVRDLKGAAIPEDDARWRKLGADLRGLLAAAPDPAQVAALIAARRTRSGLPKRVTPGVATELKLHDDSTHATIVEVSTRDRVGVLYAITQTLADLGLDISLAKISTEGEKVADVFYVTRGGRRITDDADRATLLARLRAAVEEPALV